MKLRARILRRLLVVVLFGVVVFEYTPLQGLCRSTSNFKPYPGDPRVRFEPGMENLAAVVASALPDAIASVERQQYQAFARPVRVFICATPERFASFGGPKSAGGYVLNGRLFISPKPQNTVERIPRLLTHELSHLQMEQQLGMVRYAWNIPSWFKEGLGVLVSGGGGAETVSAAEAKAAIAAGKGFTPAVRGRLLFERSGRSYGLSEHMWYRQSALLVEFLRERDDSAFRRLLFLLSGGSGFKSAVEVSYSEGWDALLKEFQANVAHSSLGGELPKPQGGVEGRQAFGSETNRTSATAAGYLILVVMRSGRKRL